ncbi:MAG: hypothetical protein Q9167_001484 [Letrouitia subvulpina]
MFSLASSEDHKQRRRIFAPAYSKTSISQQRVRRIIDSRVAKVIQYISIQSDGYRYGQSRQTPVIPRNIFRALQADVFTAFTFADDVGTQYLENLCCGASTTEELGMSMMDLCHDEKRDPFFFWESEVPFKYIARFVGRNGPTLHTNAHRWLIELVSKYEADQSETKSTQIGSKPSEFMTSTWEKLTSWRSRETGMALGELDCLSEVLDHAGSKLESFFGIPNQANLQAVAGQDAVPAALEFMIKQLSLHPDIQSKLRLELLTSLPSATEDRTFPMIESLPYLNAVVMESLRIVDTISSYQTRIVPPGGCVIAGYSIPAGTTIASQPYLINRQPHIFPNPELFDPSRWLIPPNDYRELAKSMWTYSSGPRACIGRELSLAVMKTVLAEIYSRFTTSVVNDDDDDCTEKTPRKKGSQRFTELVFLPVVACEEVELSSRNPSLFCSEDSFSKPGLSHDVSLSRLLPPSNGKHECGFQATVHEVPSTDDVGGGRDDKDKDKDEDERSQMQKSQITFLQESRPGGRGEDAGSRVGNAHACC